MFLAAMDTKMLREFIKTIEVSLRNGEVKTIKQFGDVKKELKLLQRTILHDQADPDISMPLLDPITTFGVSFS